MFGDEDKMFGRVRKHVMFLSFRMMWAAGVLAALSSITYPAISAFVSSHSDPDKQGTNIIICNRTADIENVHLDKMKLR